MNRKFRYYITDLFDGCIKGTDNADIAKAYTMSSDFFVLDTETGLWIADEDQTFEIKEIENPEG